MRIKKTEAAVRRGLDPTYRRTDRGVCPCYSQTGAPSTRSRPHAYPLSGGGMSEAGFPGFDGLSGLRSSDGSVAPNPVHPINPVHPASDKLPKWLTRTQFGIARSEVRRWRMAISFQERRSLPRRDCRAALAMTVWGKWVRVRHRVAQSAGLPRGSVRPARQERRRGSCWGFPPLVGRWFGWFADFGFGGSGCRRYGQRAFLRIELLGLRVLTAPCPAPPGFRTPQAHLRHAKGASSTRQRRIFDTPQAHLRHATGASSTRHRRVCDFRRNDPVSSTGQAGGRGRPSRSGGETRRTGLCGTGDITGLCDSQRCRRSDVLSATGASATMYGGSGWP